MRRGYVGSRWGQTHFYDNEAPQAAHDRTLYCLHATAYSGQTFLPLLSALAPSRRLVAIDTPGYGGSDLSAQKIDFAQYAESILESILQLESARVAPDKSIRSFDLFGYHTGALLATEIAAQQPICVRRLVLMGIPFFTGEAKHRWRAQLVHPTTLTESFEQFRQRWEYFIQYRTLGLSLTRAFTCFVDELRAYPREWWAHEALFDYLPEQRLPLVESPTLVLNPATALAGPSRDASALLKNACVKEMAQLSGAPFDFGAERLAVLIEDFLSDRAEASGGEEALPDVSRTASF